jgi:Putative auto-transporter adhesin, head GIN domain
MKKVLLLLTTVSILGCSKPSECVESTGKEVTKEFVLPNFSKIKVYNNISLIITEGTIQKIEVKTGENLIDNIEVTTENDILVLKDKTTCNWVREYGETKIYVTTPTLTEIICKTQKDISSNGVLHFPSLSLNSMDLTDGAGTGNFVLYVDNSNLEIHSNNVSNFYLSGKTNNLSANFYNGDGRIEAQNLLSKEINVFHRGSNDMILNPITIISGNMYSTGNIRCKNHLVDNQVVSHYLGQFIFD